MAHGAARLRAVDGIFLLVLSFVIFVVMAFWMVCQPRSSHRPLVICSLLVPAQLISKSIGHTGNWLIDWLREDDYYCLLLPLTVPVTLVASYLTWFTNKLFQHN